jgi:hypothetical protein
VTFLVATHLATALVLFGFFFEDWTRILRGLGRSLRDRRIGADDTDAKLGWLLVVGSVPAGLLGLVLKHPLRDLFASGAVGRGVPVPQQPAPAWCRTPAAACADRRAGRAAVRHRDRALAELRHGARHR